MRDVEPQANEILVVAQLDVEARLVLLDQLVLEKQRLLLVPNQHRIDILEEPIQKRDEGSRVGSRRVEIRAHPTSQIHRLADVEDFLVSALHQLYARPGGNPAQSLFQLPLHPPSPLPLN